MTKIRIHILLILLLAHIPCTKAQSLKTTIDSLQTVLSVTKDSEKANILLQIGFEYSYADSLQQGLTYLKQSLAIAEKHQQTEIIAKAYYHLGDLYFQFDDYINAQIYFLKSYNLSEQIKDKKIIIYSSAGLGSVFLAAQDWNNATKFTNKALKAAEKYHLYEDIPKLLNQMGNLFASRTLNDSALYYYNKMLDAGIELNDSTMIGFAYANIGSVLNNQGNYNEAIPLFLKSLNIKSISSKPKIVSGILNMLGEAYFKSSQFDKALEVLKKAGEISEKQGYLNIQVTNYQNFSNLYEARHDYFQSLKYYKLYASHRDSILTIEKQKQIQNLQLKNHLEQADKQVANFKQIAYNRSIISYLMIFTSILIVIIFIQIYRGFRAKIKLQESEKTKMEGTIDQQNRELVSMVMNLDQKQQLISDIEVTAKNIRSASDNKDIEGMLDNISGKIRSGSILENNWESFVKHFNGVHPSFFKNLQETHPELTNYDLKFCAFIKLNLGIKEIAQISHISTKSVYMNRYRLKIKLNLANEEDLDKYICKIG